MGLGQGRGRYLGFIDADGDIPAEQLVPLVAAIGSGDVDIVVGSKRHPGSDVVHGALRRIYSWGFQRLVLALFSLRVSDTQTGIKIFRREVLDAALPVTVEQSYAFDLELLVAAALRGFDPRGGSSCPHPPGGPAAPSICVRLGASSSTCSPSGGGCASGTVIEPAPDRPTTRPLSSLRCSTPPRRRMRAARSDVRVRNDARAPGHEWTPTDPVMPVLSALAGPTRPSGPRRDHPDPDGPPTAPSNSLAPAAIQSEHPGSLGVAIMCGVALDEVAPSGASHWFEAGPPS